MHLTLRTTLLAALLSLSLLTVGGLGYSSYYFGRRSAHELLEQNLDRASQNVFQRIERLLDTAQDHLELNRLLLSNEVLHADRFPELAAKWDDVLKISPELSGFNLALEATGELVGVSRLHDGSHVTEVVSRRPDGTFESRVYAGGRDLSQPQRTRIDPADTDLRNRPWYVAARTAGRRIWTETYIFREDRGLGRLPGVTCAIPLFDAEGKLVGVLGVDLDVAELCGYLARLNVGTGGLPFIVERHAGGNLPVIALPTIGELLRSGAKPGELELIPAAELPDPRVRGFFAQFPHEIPRDPEPRFHPIRYRVDGQVFVGGYRFVPGEETPEWLICMTLPEQVVLAQVEANNRAMLMIGVGILIVSVLASMLLSRSVARPLEALGQETAAVAQFDVAKRPVIRSTIIEVDRLGNLMEEMKAGLRSFQKFVPTDLVRKLIQSRQEARLGGETRTVTIFFSDIQDFTGISEHLAPEAIVDQLHEYLNALSGEIGATGGNVDKYIGDAIMAFWNAPRRDTEHALHACQSALACQQAVERLTPGWTAAGKPVLITRIGIHTGSVVVGNIGSDIRMNYTVIGDPVNLANRLEGLNKVYGTRILISEATRQEVGDAIVARPLDWVSVKGRAGGGLVYELLGLAGAVPPDVERLAELYAEALAHYRRQEWEAATALFEEVLQLRAGDPPAKLMQTRCQDYARQAPQADWDGVYRLTTK